MNRYDSNNDLGYNPMSDCSIIKTYDVGYIGLPDMQYKHFLIDAVNGDRAIMLANIELFNEYGQWDFDCLGAWVLNVELHDFCEN